MHINSHQAQASASPNYSGPDVQGAGGRPPRHIDQARMIYLTRRLRIPPHLASLVAILCFGEGARQ